MNTARSKAGLWVTGYDLRSGARDRPARAGRDPTAGGPTQWPQSSLYPHLNIKTVSLRAVWQPLSTARARNITQTN